MEPVSRTEVELIVNRAIAQHEMRAILLSLFLAVVVFALGLAISGAP